MPSLGPTVAALARLRKAAEGWPTAAEPAAPALREQSFAPNPGGLRMLTFAPRDLAPGAPLVVLLHGCGQTAEGFAATSGWRDLADRSGIALLVPEQTAANNPGRCFNWFEAGDTRRGYGEAASIRAMAERMILDHAIDKKRVFVTGLSAGGAMAAALLAAYPDVFAAGAVIAGTPVGVAEGMVSAFGLMRSGTPLSGPALGGRLAAAGAGPQRPPRLAVWHGDADQTVAAANALALARQWTTALGLPEKPTRTERLERYERRTWTSAGAGPPQLELNIVHGLDHGAPLATEGPDGLGAAAPFMLETGVSSTREIARFFGLKSAEGDGGRSRRPEAAGPVAGGWRRPPFEVPASLAERVPLEVRETIRKALKAAGLG